MRVLSIDPGPQTGFCIYDTTARRNHGFLDCWTEDWRNAPDKHSRLWLILETTWFDLLICEKFEFRKDDQARDKIDYTAAELVGVVKLYSQQTQSQLVMQGSSVVGKTAFWSDDNARVKKLKLYKAGAAPHGMDAMRHILYYQTFTRGDDKWLTLLK